MSVGRSHETNERFGGKIWVTGLLWAGATAIGLSAAPLSAQSLKEALATAYDSNPTLLAARAELRAVNEGVPQALSNWRPDIEVTGSGGLRHSDSSGGSSSSSTSTKPAEVTFGVTQPLYRGSRTIAQTKRAEADVRAQRARLSTVEQRLLLDASTAYTDVWRDQAVLQLQINNEKVLARQLEASRDRFEVGEFTRTDVAQSESRLARATAARIEAEGDLTSNRAVYQEVIGVYPGMLGVPPMPDGLPTNQAEVTAAALENNPNLLAARFAEAAAGHETRQVVGELLPRVNLAGELRHSEETSGKDSENDRAQILAQVIVPLYQQGAVSSRVRAAKQRNNQRRLEIDEARRDAEQTAISAWEDLATAMAQISAFESEVRSTTIALEGVRQENEVGARTVLDILDAEQEFLDAQVSLTRAQRNEIVAGYTALSAMGRLTAADLGLSVDLYDPESDYRAVRDRWYGLGP